MGRHKMWIGAAVALALAAGACNRDATDTRNDAVKADEKVADEAAAIEKERRDDIANFTERAAQLERDYADKSAVLASGKRSATQGLHDEVQEDVNNAKQAVANLGTTTAENWWTRQEDAMRAALDDVAADAKRFGARMTESAPAAPGETPATAPFTSRRDSFVAEMKGRVDALDRALEKVTAKGARETELDDTRDRVKKIAADLDRLAAVTADDLCDVSRDHGREYLDRVETSIKRLDDNKPKA